MRRGIVLPLVLTISFVVILVSAAITAVLINLRKGSSYQAAHITKNEIAKGITSYIKSTLSKKYLYYGAISLSPLTVYDPFLCLDSPAPINCLDLSVIEGALSGCSSGIGVVKSGKCISIGNYTACAILRNKEIDPVGKQFIFSVEVGVRNNINYEDAKRVHFLYRVKF